MRRAAACADYSITGTAMLDIKGRKILFSNGVFEKLHREAIETIKERVDENFEEENVIHTLLGGKEEMINKFFENIMKKEKWEGRSMLAPSEEAGELYITVCVPSCELAKPIANSHPFHSLLLRGTTEP